MILKFPAFLVAGTHSGVGKTTVTFTLLSLLSDEGFKVQPFKIGPDFIDGGYHRLATGKGTINLDLWMMGWKGIQESYARYASGEDAAVIEGMGALYDGKNGTTSGSSAEIAKNLKTPIVLVLDIWGMTVTTGAILDGLLKFDRRVILAGIILNRAGSREHYEMVMKSLRPFFRKKVLGYLPYSKEFEIPERHLGLKTLEENQKAERVKKALIETAKKTIDLPRLVRALGINKKRVPKRHRGAPARTSKVRIGVAKDSAFCFYYAENLRALQEAGAELVSFSPLKARTLPTNLDGLYIGGGYPESFPKELSMNKTLKGEILLKIKEGMPVYAECGGLMYLSKSITGFDGKKFSMVGALPLKVKMDHDHLTIRYVEIKTTRDSLLGPKGTVARGQEFHHSGIISNGYRGKPVFKVITSTQKIFMEGFKVSDLLASYIHLYFNSNPLVPAFFVSRCRNYGISKIIAK